MVAFATFGSFPMYRINGWNKLLAARLKLQSFRRQTKKFWKNLGQPTLYRQKQSLRCHADKYFVSSRLSDVASWQSADFDRFFEKGSDVHDRALVAGVDREEGFVKIDMFANFFDSGEADREIDRVVCSLTAGAELD